MRGDGNCYYRAVIFGLIEQIIRTNQRAAFRELHAQVGRASVDDLIYESGFAERSASKRMGE